MLDNNVKHRIDTACDILDEEMPDSKLQYEQVTIALIYKFLDNLDTQNKNQNGKRKFFIGQFANHEWAKLTQPTISGYELLRRYSEAITLMSKNPAIPPLLQAIFANTFFPYLDPETLRKFLETINEFTDVNPTQFGDAFEYLITICGTTVDTGQFLTPRHIINFIVTVINPKKDEIVLDPACGTAGFLISAYKHVLASNGKKNDLTLNPDTKTQLHMNFVGYDISQDATRASLVNMYLHGILQPRIYEYDTLKNEERWNEQADVILTNLPFMSPRNRIRPHSRFSISAIRGELLFLDYIAKHLTAQGRAGIIIPESILFLGLDAYKQLRKLLVNDYLVAVVSLSGKVFNPHSHVNTSILILDRTLAKKIDVIAFFKVETDSFASNIQHSSIDQDNLLKVQTDLCEFLRYSYVNKCIEDFKTTVGVIIKKEHIAADAEYNLMWARYENEAAVDHTFPVVELKSIAQVMTGNLVPKNEVYFTFGEFTFIKATDVGLVHRSDHFNNSVDKVNQKTIDELHLQKFPKGTILFPKSGATVFMNHRVRLAKPAYVESHLVGIVCDEKKASSKYIYHLLCQIDDRSIASNKIYPSLSPTEIGKIKISLPPLETQQEIVAEIEGYQKIIDGAKIMVENYRPRIVVDMNWPIVTLGNVCTRIQSGLSLILNTKELGYKIFRMNDLVEGKAISSRNMKFAELPPEIFKKHRLTRGDILFSRSGSMQNIGRAGIFDLDGHYCFASSLLRLTIATNMANPFYINAILNTDTIQFRIKQHVERVTSIPNINAKTLATIPVPLPSITTQNRIVTELNAQRVLMDANKGLIKEFEQNIQTVLSKVWRDEVRHPGDQRYG